MNGFELTGFEIIEKLGEGGMASVWRARQISLDRIVAIKVLSARLAVDPSDVKRFQTEAQAAARLKHPGIVQVYDANVENGLYYFVMEYVDGYTVGDWVRRKGALSEKDALLVADCVADALEYAWDNQSIIHCDVKPDNVIIDADGSVKVADLGLARTISAMSAEMQSDEIMGTPAYISPEQARGSADLDCRSDIYSLGAMLYHLLTGHLLFEGNADEKIVDLQISASVDDPYDANPKLSRAVCWLMETMLAKNRDAREKDWTGVRRDIARVRRGLPPARRLSAGVVSTIKRSEHRQPDAHSHHHSPTHHHDEESSPWPKVLVTVGVLAVIILGVFLVGRPRRPASRSRVHPRSVTTMTTQPPVKLPATYAEQDARDMYNYAARWLAENPDKYDLAIRQFQRVAKQTQGTKYSLMAEDQVRDLIGKRKAAVDAVMADLRKRWEPLEKAGSFLPAAAILERYEGPWMNATHAERLSIASRLRDAHDEEQRRRLATVEDSHKKCEETLDRIAALLIGEGVEGALPAMTAALVDATLADAGTDMADLKKVLDGAARMDERILESFRSLKGESVTIHTTSGVMTFVVTDVRDDQILGAEQFEVAGTQVAREHSVELAELSARERLLRMGTDDLPDVALVKGLMAYNLSALDYARKYFAATHPLLSERLLAYVDAAETKTVEGEAEKALVRVLQSLGIPATSYDQDACVGMVGSREFTLEERAAARQAVLEYKAAHGKTSFAKQAEPVLAALATPVPDVPTTEGPAPQGDAAEPVRSVFLKMAARNPGLTAENLEFGVDGVRGLHSLSVISPRLADLSPLSALASLRDLSCGAAGPDDYEYAGPRAPLANISPLAGMKLRRLSLAATSVSELSVLKDMPLEFLSIAGTLVNDLTPLRGLPLVELRCQGCKVVDLAPLKGALIRHIRVDLTVPGAREVLQTMPRLQTVNGEVVTPVGGLRVKPRLRKRMLDPGEE